MSNTRVADKQLFSSNGSKNLPENRKLASKQNTNSDIDITVCETNLNINSKKANNVEQLLGSEASAESSASSWNGNNSNGSGSASNNNNNNNKGLSLVLPQVNKNSLVTPTICVTAAAEQPVTSLFSSLIPFNVQEAGRFTGLPSFTPTSADALASSNLSAINPFFRNITFSNHSGGSGGELASDQLLFYQHQSEPEERNASGEGERQLTTNPNAANSQDQNKDGCQRLSKLSLDQAVAANAFGQPFLASPLLLLSPDQEQWLRHSLAAPGQHQQSNGGLAAAAAAAEEPNSSTLAYQQTQQHQRLVSAAVVAAAANSQDLSNQIAAHRNGLLIANSNQPYLAHNLPATTSQFSPSSGKPFNEQQSVSYQQVGGPNSNETIGGGSEIANAQQVLNSLQQSPTNHQHLYQFQSSSKAGECSPNPHSTNHLPAPSQVTNQQLDTNHHLSASSQWGTNSARGQPLAGPPVAHHNSDPMNKRQPANLVMVSDGTNQIDPKIVEYQRQQQQQQQYFHQDGQVVIVTNPHQQQLQRTNFHCDANQPVGICEPHLRQFYLSQHQNCPHQQQLARQRQLPVNGQELYMRTTPTQAYHVQQQQQANAGNQQTLPTGENNLPASETVHNFNGAEVNQRKLSETVEQSICQLNVEKQLPPSPKKPTSRPNSLIDGANESSSHQSISCATNSSPARSSVSRDIQTAIDASSSPSPCQQQPKLNYQTRDRLIVSPPKRSISVSKTKVSSATSTEKRLNQLKQSNKRSISMKEPDSSKDVGGEIVVKKKSKGGRKKKQVTHEELMARKNRSKERNRVAAKRCRQKRKQFLDELRGQIDELNESKKRLQKENISLRNELDHIKQLHRNCTVR